MPAGGWFDGPMQLRAMVVADPVGNVAELVTSQCRRLAEQRLVATVGEQTLALVAELQPEVLVASLEIKRPAIDKLIPRIIKIAPEILIIATFRELTVPQMEQLSHLGIDDFITHPINATEIFRAVSRRFHLPFRQFPRFDTQLKVHRTDGALLGETLNISEGGLRIKLLAHLAVDESIMLALDLPDAPGKPMRARFRVLAIEAPTGGQTVARGYFDNLRGEEQRRLATYVAGLEQAYDLANPS